MDIKDYCQDTLKALVWNIIRDGIWSGHNKIHINLDSKALLLEQSEIDRLVSKSNMLDKLQGITDFSLVREIIDEMEMSYLQETEERERDTDQEETEDVTEEKEELGLSLS
jgi:hypothetical protein